MTSQPSPLRLPQDLRDKFASAIESKDVQLASQMLAEEPALANADLRTDETLDGFTNGFPLFRACQQNHSQLAELLLKHGANPDAQSSNPKDRPEHGMPLHFAAEHLNYPLAKILLDHQASPNGFPHCDQATIERVYYRARDAGMTDSVVRRAYSRFLPDQEQLTSRTTVDLVGEDAAEPIKLFARMVDFGGQPPFSAIIRDGLDDLALEIAQHCPMEDGTPHDHPNSTAFNNIFGPARWHGYPKLFHKLMDIAIANEALGYDIGSALTTIEVAIGSHNRDGGFPEYREIILMQLEHLKSIGELEKANKDFKPLFKMATDFTWHSNYGYRAEIAEPECYVDLAELFVSWGFNDINYRNPETDHSPLSAAVKRGHHPGIATYIRWLLKNGADLRESDPDEVNPKAIALEKGLTGIHSILDDVSKS